MTSEQGRVYESRARVVVTAVNSGITDSETTTVSRTVIDTRELLNQPLESSDRERSWTTADHQYHAANDRIFVGTLSRGVLEIANGGAKESQMKPPAFLSTRWNAIRTAISGSARAQKKKSRALLSGE
jgi:hypothetical protein